MNKNRECWRLLIVQVSCLYLLPFLCVAQFNNSGFQSIRSLGMGGAGVASEGTEALFENQSAGAFEERSTVMAGAWQRFTLAELTQVGALAQIPVGQGRMGIEVNQDGDELFKAQKFGLHYSRALSPKIAVAAQLNYMQIQFDEHGQGGNINVELSALAKLLPQLNIGVHIYSPTPQQINEVVDIPGVVHFGLQYMPSETLHFVGDFVKASNDKEDIRIGGQFHAADRLWLRLGVQTLSSSASFGFGFSLKENFVVDGAVSWNATLGVSPGIQLRYNW